MSMAATPHGLEGSMPAPVLHVALELSAKDWKVGLTPGLGRSPRVCTLAAGNLAGLEREIERARRRFGLAEDVRVVSCYEAGRDGFWIHRELVARGFENHVVDSASIEVNRRKRRRKSDRLDLGGLLRMLARYVAGEREVWRVVHVPSPEAEDRRHLHREIWTLTQERTERTNRIKSLLATQGLALPLGADFLPQLREVRVLGGRPLGSELRARLEREWVRRDSVVKEIHALEAERRARVRHADGDPALEQVRALMAFRGIGLRSAWLFVMEFFAWRHFRNRREVGALGGLAPASYQSGTDDRSPGIDKAGNVWVRTMAIEIAWSWIRHQPDSAITQWFNRRFAHAGSRARRRGITAVARKLLVALWRYLDHGVVPDGAVFKDA